MTKLSQRGPSTVSSTGEQITYFLYLCHWISCN